MSVQGGSLRIPQNEEMDAGGGGGGGGGGGTVIRTISL